MLREAGWNLVTLAERYGIPADEEIQDVTWLRDAGTEGWPVLMKDDRIRYRDAERQALVEHHVRAFCLTGGNLRAADMVACFETHRDVIWEACTQPGPLLFAVSRHAIRHVDL